MIYKSFEVTKKELVTPQLLSQLAQISLLFEIAP